MQLTAIGKTGEWVMETVISLIPNNEHVATTRQALETAGFAKSRISVLFQPADVWQRLGGRQKVRAVAKKAALGALIGLVVGAIYGISAGLFNYIFMHCPLETSVILWALISLYWLVAGGFLGAIIGLDRLERDLFSYVEGVRRGEALFVVKTSEERVQEAEQILRQEQGTVIHDIHEETEAR
jgi:hypothetical protein